MLFLSFLGDVTTRNSQLGTLFLLLENKCITSFFSLCLSGGLPFLRRLGK